MNEVWNRHALWELNHLASAQQRHSKSQTHVHCYVQLKLCRKQQGVNLLLDTQHTNVTSEQEQVKKNREILRGFIDALCSLASQEIPFRCHD